jgi:tetratricopeptide (TPR) repeat protein
VAELRAELNEKGLPVVEAVWDAAYRGLSARAARLYLLLAEHPTAHFPPEAPAAALGEGQDAADEALDELETASLLEVRLDGHLHLHELLRAHARRRAREDGDPEQAAAAALRVIRWYRRQAERADLLAAGRRMRFAGPAQPALPYAPDVPLADEAEARRWLDQERLGLVGCVRLAYEHGADADAWALCEPLWTHFVDHRPYADAIDAFRTGIAAAGRAGQPAAQARMRCQLARPLWEQGRFDEAREQVDQAVAAAQALGASADPRLLPSTLEFRGYLLAAEGDWSGAATAFEHSLALHRDIGNDYGVLLLTHLLGRAAARLGEARRAVGLLTEAHAMARAQRRERLIGRTAHELGLACQALGETGRAAELLDQALENARRRGSAYEEARIRRDLAGVVEAEGDAEAARAHREAASAIQARAGALPEPSSGSDS